MTKKRIHNAIQNRFPLNPFDKVMFKDEPNGEWKPGLFHSLEVNLDEPFKPHPFFNVCDRGEWFDVWEIAPLNIKHLGTKEDAFAVMDEEIFRDWVLDFADWMIAEYLDSEEEE